MAKRKPLCIIKLCNKRGKFRAIIDIGPTHEGSIVPESARKHKVWLCPEHHQMMGVSPSHIEYANNIASGDRPIQKGDIVFMNWED